MSKFDKAFKNKLEHYQSKVSDDMWDNIAANITPEKKSPLRWLIIPVMTSIIITISLLGYHFSTTSNVENNVEDKFESSISQSLTGNGDKSLGYVDENSNKITTDNPLSSVENTTTKKHLDKVINQKNIVINPNKVRQRTKRIIKDSQSIQNDNLSNNSEINETTEQKGIEEGVVKTFYEQYGDIVNKTRRQSAEDYIQRDDIAIEDLERSISTLEVGDNPVGLNMLFVPKPACPTFHPSRFGVFIEGIYSHDYAIRSLSYNGPISEDDYLSLRNETEQASYSYTTGVRFNVMHSSGLGLKSGLTTSRINETFKFVDPNSKQTQIIQIKDYTWENGAIIDSTITEKVVETQGNLRVVHQNRYTTIDMPLLLTYEWGFRKKWYYSVTAGTVLNLKFSQEGKFIDPNSLEPVSFNSDEGQIRPFTANIGSSIYLSAAINYQLGSGFDLFVEPSLRHFLKNATANNYPLDQRYTLLGLNMGVKYKL